MKLTIKKVKDLILEVLSEITKEESAEIQAKKVLNFLQNSLKFSPKTKSRYISDKTVFLYNGKEYIFTELEQEIPKEKRPKFYLDVNREMKQMTSSLEGETSVEKIEALKNRVSTGSEDSIEKEIAKLILRGFVKVGTDKDKQTKRDIKKKFMEQNKAANEYFTGIHNIGFGYTSGGAKGLKGLTEFIKSKQSRQNDEESVWVFNNVAGQKIPLYQGFNLEIEGPFTMIYPAMDAMTDRWDGQHGQGGGDKSKQAMGGRRFVKHSGLDFYNQEEQMEIDPELGIWSALADTYKKQRQGGLTGNANLLEGTMIGGVKNIIVQDEFKKIYFFILRNSLQHLMNQSRRGKQIDYSNLNERGGELFEFGKVLEENKIGFKDAKLIPIEVPIVSSAESLVKLIFGEEKQSLSSRDLEKLKRISKKFGSIS